MLNKLIIICILLFCIVTYNTTTYIIDLKEKNYNLTNINKLNNQLIKSQNQTIISKNNEIEYYNQTLNEQTRLTHFYIDESKYYASLDNKFGMTPRWSDVESFLKNNLINKNKWDEDKYDCTAFTNDLIIEALNNNIFMCTVEIEWKDGGHIIVAVNTSDKGLIYIEPQTDNVIDLSLGLNGHSGFPDNFVMSYDSCFERMIYNE